MSPEKTLNRAQIIEQKIQDALHPASLEVIDDSAHHIGHAGSREGAGHYTVIVTSEQFEGLSTLKRHQLVYAALKDMIPQEIHALQIRAKTPGE